MLAILVMTRDKESPHIMYHVCCTFSLLPGWIYNNSQMSRFSDFKNFHMPISTRWTVISAFHYCFTIGNGSFNII